MIPFPRLGFRKKRAQVVAAIDPQGGVTGVVLRSSKAKSGKFPVSACFVQPGEAASPLSLARVAEKGVIRGAFKVLVLPRGEYQITQVDKPEVKQEELDQSLRWALTPLIDYPAAEANIDWLPVPYENNQNRKPAQLLVVSTPKGMVDQQAALYASANLNLDAIDIRETSQKNIAAQLGGEGRGVCLVNAEPSGIQITITLGADLYLERFIRETVFGNNEAPDNAQFDRIALEIQRSIDFMRRVYPAVQIEEVLIAPTLQPIDLAGRLAGLMQEPVRAVDLGSIFEWPAGSGLESAQQQARYFYALGAALRHSTPEA